MFDQVTLAISWTLRRSHVLDALAQHLAALAALVG